MTVSDSLAQQFWDEDNMNNLGYGYGSAWHLLRFMGYHRGEFDAAVLASTGGNTINWLDFHYNCARPLLDQEWRGLECPGIEDHVRQAWRNFWPTSDTVQRGKHTLIW